MAGENINRRLNIYINDKEVVNSMSGITREMGKTRNELKNLNKNAADYDSEVTRLTKHLSDLTEKQDEFKSELKLTNKEMGAARDNFTNLLGGLATGDMEAVKAGLMGIRGSIVATMQAGWAFIATPIGAFIATLVGFGVAAKAVFDFNEEIRESNQLLDNLGVSQRVRADIQGLVETFKVGFDEIANAVDNMVDLGLVKDEFEALEQIKAGLVKAPNKNEFLSMLNDNGIAAKNLGLTLEDVISLNESFEKTGGNAQAIFGALQKSSSTLILQSPQLKKSLDSAFGGAFTSDLLSKVKSGELTYYQALDRIYKKGEELGISNRKQAQIAKDLFGKSSIAAGGYEMILKNVNNAQEKNTEALTETQKQVESLAKSEIELAKQTERALKADGFNAFKNGFLIAINDMKRNWYKFIEWLSTTDAERKKAREDERKQELDQQSISSFKAWLDKQIEAKKKALGDAYDYQVVKENLLAKLRDQIAAADLKHDEAKSHRLRIWYKTLQDLQQKTPDAKAGAELSDDEQKAKDSAASKRAKQIEDAKKHSEDLFKIEADLQKKLIETKSEAESLLVGIMKDGFEKELAEINAEYDKKIELAVANAAREQHEIEKLKTSLAGKGLSNEDRTSYQRQLDDRIEIQKNYNTQAISLEQTRNIKIGTLREKYINIAFQKENERAARELQNLKTRQNFQLAEITSLEKAKQLVSQTLSSEELRKITTLEQAKKVIKEKGLKEQYDLEAKNLERLIALYNEQLNGGFSVDFQTLSPEQREEVLKFLDDAKNKLSEIKAAGSGADEIPKENRATTGVDVLGFDAAQWENAFANLDTFEGKLNAISMVAGALQNAFSTYFKFLEASENRQMRDYERNNNKKKKFLADQLEKGLISQEVYNAKIAKLDSDVARKKAELEYKQAKRQKAMAIVDAVVKTAVGIMNAYASLDPISASIAAALIGALGALQIATIAKQPLPSKDGFKEGGYTGDGPNTGVAGDAHFKEYVIPENVLFSNDPVVPNIVGYLESKRQGRTPQLKSADTATEQSSTSFQVPATASDGKMLNVLSRLSDILDKIEKYGIKAWLSNDLRTAKNIRESIKEYEDLKNQAKQ